MDLLPHPASCVSSLLDKDGAHAIFSFYKYVPDSPEDDRRVVVFECGSGGVERALALADSAGESEECAMHSLVTIDGFPFHIPMLDLACSELGPYQKKRLEKYLDSSLCGDLAFFDSGRSFHAYGGTLISPSDWAGFMGSSLLANEPCKDPVVDSRWVGHRLRAGYAALRWTANAPRSLKIPTRIVLKDGF